MSVNHYKDIGLLMILLIIEGTLLNVLSNGENYWKIMSYYKMILIKIITLISQNNPLSGTKLKKIFLKLSRSPKILRIIVKV